MLSQSKAFSGFAVDDLEQAREFYGDTLGLEVGLDEENGLLTLHLAGDRDTLVYPKPDFKPADVHDPQLPGRRRRGRRRRAGLARRRASSATTASSRTRRASPTGPGPKSPGSRTRRATSWRCSKARAEHQLQPPAAVRARL